jgi:putative membrane protein
LSNSSGSLRYPDKVLIICIDADNDVGQKTGLKTPIKGRDMVLEAGMRMALSDPEEADANAIFAAVSNYDKIVSSGSEAEVVLVSGNPEDKILSSQKMVAEIKEISNVFGPKAIYVVTDGFGDEDIVPVLNANLPLSGIIRVVVKHSRSVEESYVVLGRYLKMFFTDTRFKKYFLSIPGAIMVTLPMLAYLGKLTEALLLLSIAIGSFAFIKGLDLDKSASVMLHRIVSIDLPTVHYIGFIIFYLTGGVFVLAALAIGISGSYEAAVNQNINDLVGIFSNVPLLLGEFIRRSALFFILGAIFLVGRDFIVALEREPLESKTPLLTMASIASLYPFLISLGDALVFFEGKFLSLVMSSIVSLVSIAIMATIILIGYRFLGKHLKGAGNRNENVKT